MKCPYCEKQTSFWNPYSPHKTNDKNNKTTDYYTPCCFRWRIKNEWYNIFKQLQHFCWIKLKINIKHYVYGNWKGIKK